MASCSKHAQPEPEFEPWVNDLSLPVPIQFGTTGFEGTKAAPVDAVDDLEGREIGVFGINRATDSDWSNTDNQLLVNEKATYNKSTHLLDFETPQFYPPKSDLNYTFYGYYVRSLNTTTTPGANLPQPTVADDAFYFPVTFGNTDYLWAKSVATTAYGADGFNAKYIRLISKKNSYQTYMPKFNFRHVTAGVQIWAKGDDDGITTNGAAGESDTDDMYSDIQVCSVVVVNAISSADFCIAHKTDADNEGQFFSVSNIKDIKMTALTSAGGEVDDLTQGVNSCKPTVAGTRLGNDLFLYPGENYQIDIYYTTAASQTPAKYTINTSVVGGLAAGTQYKYTLIFHKTRAIEISVTLQAWAMTEPVDFDTDPA